MMASAQTSAVLGWKRKIGWTLAVAYCVIAVFFVFHFNYRVIQTRGLLYWILPGELEATVRGVLWPYFWQVESAHERLAVALSGSEGPAT